MSYILKTFNKDKPMYYYKMCRKVYQDEEIPAFREDIEDSYVFDTKERAIRMRAIICSRYPEINLVMEELKEVSLRGKDGYVPLEKTVKAMLSDDFRHRLWAEYEQLNTRRHLLKEYGKNLPSKTEADRYEKDLVDEQIKSMHDYMISILDRCRLLNIDLSEVEKEIE